MEEFTSGQTSSRVIIVKSLTSLPLSCSLIGSGSLWVLSHIVLCCVDLHCWMFNSTYNVYFQHCALIDCPAVWLCWKKHNVVWVCVWCTEWHESVWPQVILCLTVLPFSDVIWMCVCDLRYMEGLEMKKDKMKFCPKLQSKYQNGKPHISSQSHEYHVEKKQKSQYFSFSFIALLGVGN